MDQTFSTGNIRRAWDFETRKGVNLAKKLQLPGDPLDIHLHGLKANYSATARARKALRDLRKASAAPDKILKAEERLKALRGKRDDLVNSFLARVRDSLEDPSFSIGISVSYRAGGANVFGLEAPYPMNFMAIKVLTLNLRRAFSLRHTSRDDIMSQVSRLLDDHYPKSVVRADVSKFYESIDHARLLQVLRESSVLSTASLTLISKLLGTYARITGSPVGVPRGIGVSADLSEVFMLGFDAHFKQKESTVFYTRFVDDILLISRPDAGTELLAEVVDELAARGLAHNAAKSGVREMPNGGPLPHFTFLGYSIEYKDGRLLIGLSPSRVDKLERRLDASFAAYLASRSPSATAKTMLMKRVRFLTTNTRLANNKRNAFVGIRYSNRLVNNPAQMDALDARLDAHISKLPDLALAKKLRGYSFADGWSKETFTRHRFAEFTAIASAWRTLG